jgi:diguanylate cyclase (GGDEF)-like protein/PAS domain S-box-containing protein
MDAVPGFVYYCPALPAAMRDGALPDSLPMSIRTKENALRLILIDDSSTHAEAIVSTLRNAGIAVRPAHPQDPQELARLLAEQPFDLVLASHAHALPLPQVLTAVAASGKDVPVVLVADGLEENDWVGAFALGARAVALRTRPEQLLGMVRAEWDDLETRRKLRRIETQMRETERRCDALIASSRDPIAYVHEGMHIRANEAYLEMFGVDSFEDVEGVSLLDMIAPRCVDDFRQLLRSLSRGEPPPPHYEVDARRMDGDTFPATLEFATATYEGEPCIQVVFRRREEFDPELAREVEDLRQRDSVTGLLNRPAFLLALEGVIARAGRGEIQAGLLLVEPDHYARLLPEIGLDAADTLIAAMAAHLRGCAGEPVQLARFGETTFAVLAEGRYADTQALAERIRTAFAAHVFSAGARSATVTVSVGGVQIGEKIANLGQVLAKASASVQAANELGGNTVQIFDPAAADRAEEERVQRWLERLREAIAHDHFLLHFQPVLSLQGEPGELYETFLRLDNNGEIIAPAHFLGIAEEHGLMPDIDCWVVAHAIAVLGERHRAGRDTRLLVKVSAESFDDPRLLGLIRQGLARAGVPSDRLWLQAPESKVFTHLRSAQQFLADVSALGCRMGLEQFGSGLDSFQLLHHFLPAFLKLDRGFTRDLALVKEHQAKIADIVERAHADHVKVLAEFVSDAGSMSQLFGIGVDYVEGEFVGLAGAGMDYDF